MIKLAVSAKTILILLCVFVAVFKFSASSVFIQNAIERAELYTGVSLNINLPDAALHTVADDVDDDTTILNFMAHVTGLVSGSFLLIEPNPRISKIARSLASAFPKDAIPDSLFRPPRYPSLM